MTRCLNLVCFSILLFISAKAQTTAHPSYSDPSLSPDGSEIAFVSGGDIWTVPAAGGEARLLISNPATESRPLYSPDGKHIVFNSTRTGNGDVYLLTLQGGEMVRLTYDDGVEEVSAWSQDGLYVYFSSVSRDIAGMRDIYRVRSNGGTPMTVADNRYVNEFQAAPAPDGNTIAFAARGFGSHQWWRNGRSHLDESEIWLLKEGSNEYSQLASRGARQLWPMWSRDGKSLYYVSDRSGKENLWIHPLNGSAKQLTGFTTGRMLWPSISAGGEHIVFERDFAIWKYDIGKGEAHKVPINLRGVPSAPSIERTRMTSGFRDLVISPDGKKVGFVARGEVFVASTKDGGDATRITTTPREESGLVWSNNSNALIYISQRDGGSNLYQYNFITGKEIRLTEGTGINSAPVLSPSGKTVAYVRNGQELHVLDLDSKKDHLVTKGYFGRPPFQSTRSLSWSPDGKWIAYGGYGAKSLRNIYVVPASGGEARPVSFLANAFGSNVQWAQDGKSILFTTSQRTENGYVAKVDLVPQQPRFREDQFRDLFAEPVTLSPSGPKKEGVVDSMMNKATNPKSRAAVRIVWEGIQSRISMLPLRTDIADMALSKDGNTLIVTAQAAGQVNIFAYTLDELSKDAGVLKQLTFTPGNKSDIQLSADGKEVYFLESGRIQSVSLDAKVVKPLAVTAEMDVDFAMEKEAVFEQAWDMQNNSFYDPAFHGRDWAAIRKQYAPYAAGAQNPDELRRVLNLMVGELNASHSGVSGSTPPLVSPGKLGLRFDRAVYEREGKLRVTEVIALSPAALTENVAVGDYLLSVDGKYIEKGDNLDQLLDNKVNRRVVLSFGSSAKGSDIKEVVVRPVNTSTEKGLLYKQWVQQQRDYVKNASGGRLGYVHMFDMGQPSLDQLYLDMDAENHASDGVVVDVRNNNGGFVNAYALDVLSRKGYMTMTVRGLPAAPARVQLG